MYRQRSIGGCVRLTLGTLTVSVLSFPMVLRTTTSLPSILSAVRPIVRNVSFK